MVDRWYTESGREEIICLFYLAKLSWYSTQCTELLQGSVVKLWNPLKLSELKEVLFENCETIFMPRNLKSFRKKVRNFESSVENLFFLEWWLWIFCITNVVGRGGESTRVCNRPVRAFILFLGKLSLIISRKNFSAIHSWRNFSF